MWQRDCTAVFSVCAPVLVGLKCSTWHSKLILYGIRTAIRYTFCIDMLMQIPNTTEYLSGIYTWALNMQEGIYHSWPRSCNILTTNRQQTVQYTCNRHLQIRCCTKTPNSMVRATWRKNKRNFELLDEHIQVVLCWQHLFHLLVFICSKRFTSCHLALSSSYQLKVSLSRGLCSGFFSFSWAANPDRHACFKYVNSSKTGEKVEVLESGQRW